MSHNLLTQASFDFLKEIRENNNKQWFVENKSDYTKFIYDPLQNVVMLLQDILIKIDVDFVLIPNKCISRIYNDMRFSRNKGYLKDCVWLTFKTADKSIQPAYFLEIKENSFRYGMGYYHADPAAMQKFRNNIDNNLEKFTQIMRDIKHVGDINIFGDHYKKPFENNYDGIIGEYYNLKGIYAAYNSSDISLLQKDQFYHKIINDYWLLKDSYSFLKV